MYTCPIKYPTKPPVKNPSIYPKVSVFENMIPVGIFACTHGIDKDRRSGNGAT
jgi:hypothetical protein